MHIVHVTNDLRLNGTGHTNSTIDLAIAQVDSGAAVTLICLTSDDSTRRLLNEHGVRLVEGIGGQHPASLMRGVRRLRKLTRRADVLHVHTVYSLAVLAIGGPLRSWSRSVATLHNPHQRSTALLFCARRIVTLSQVHRQRVRRQTLALINPTVILNGTLGTPRLSPVGELIPVRLEPSTLLFVGALHGRKGLDVLLHAMQLVLRQVPDARLCVVGNRDAPEFEVLADELGIADRVQFAGFAPDPRTFMLSASAFILPSRQEGFGNVLTEARECGVPIIASRVGGIPEALSDGRAGLLVEPNDAAELASAVVKVLLDADVAASLKVAAADGLEQMRPARAVEEYERVYQSLRRRGQKSMPRGGAITGSTLDQDLRQK